MKVAGRKLLFRLGPFTVDGKAHELRRDGERVPLQEKQFRLLMALVERPNEIVSRSELRDALWPQEDFGEFDIGLNQAVRRLRRALGDSASHPVWIETVPKSGYRFIGPLEPQPDRRRAIFGSSAAGIVLAVLSFWLYPRPVQSALDASALMEVALTSYQGQEISPSFSPDGRRIAYSHKAPYPSEWNVYVEEIESGKPLQLTDLPGQNLAPAWSPDGRSIAFVHRDSRMTSGELLVIPASGGPATKLMDLDCRDVAGLRLDWSPDGAKILFSGRSEPRGPLRIGILDVALRRSRWLTAPEAALFGDTQPVLSPDGSELAFVRRSAYESGWNVFVLGLTPDFAARSAPRQITQFQRIATSPDWSLDGNRILFLGAKGPGHEGIWSVSAQGNGEPALVWRSPGVLLESSVGNSSLTVSESPAGGPIIAYTFGTEWDQDIFRIDLHGPNKGKPSKLISTSFRDAAPRYSPDGAHIAFHSGGPTRDLWLADADGSNLTRATRLDSRVIGPPDWSPDSREIAFHARQSGTADIYVVNADTHHLRTLIKGASQYTFPTWSRDGKWIYFMSARRGDTGIWKIPAQGGEPVRLFNQRSRTAAESIDGRLLFFSDSISGDFLQANIGSSDPPKLLWARGGREVMAFQVSRSGLFFVAKEDPIPTRRDGLAQRAGMLSLLQLDSDQLQPLFPVEGYVSSVAPDESNVLSVNGRPLAVDLKLLRPPTQGPLAVEDTID